MQYRTVRVEVWPIAVDEQGIWLVSGLDAWRPAEPVGADSDAHAEVELVMAAQGRVARDEVKLLHSTSWREEGPSTVLTYVAVLDCPGPVRGHWSDAAPCGPRLARFVGRPASHPATAPPVPRHSDVLMHALRHLRMLWETDDDAREAMGPTLGGHLETLRPVLAGMYRRDEGEEEGDRPAA